MIEVIIFLVFIAGIVTFLSPCILPILPGFLAYLGSLGKSKNDLFINTIFYVIGFTLVFSILGVILSAFFKGTAYTTQTILSRIGGIIIILFGLYTIGIFKISFLQKSYNFQLPKIKNQYFASTIFGASFAIGWSPCVGAILGSVLTLAITNPSLGFIYLLVFSTGLSIPFLLVGYYSEFALTKLNKFKPLLMYFNIFAGILLIILGFLMFTQTIYYISNFYHLEFLYDLM